MYSAMCETASPREPAVWRGELTPALCDSREGQEVGGGSGGRGHMYTCGWCMLLCGRNQHDIVKQSSAN